MSGGTWLPLAPFLAALITALAAFPLRDRVAGRLVSVAGAVAELVAAAFVLRRVMAEGPLAGQLGGWAAPYGITVVADPLASAMLVLTGVVALATVLYACADVGVDRERMGFHTVFHLLVMACCGAFVAGDVFNLYVWFEVILMASFALLVLGGERRQIDGGVKYLVLNMLATLLFLAGIALLYGLTGTLNMADLRSAVAHAEPMPVTIAAALFLAGFAIKGGLFPLFGWLPASYHTPPVPVAALFAALLTKVGIYALIRLFTLVFVHDTGFTHVLLVGMAVATMVVGVLGAAVQGDMRRLLTFNVVSQMGFITLGLGLLTPAGLVAAVFYLVQDVVVKTALFLSCGLIQRASGGETDLSRLGGLWTGRPWLALAFAPPALALAGIPPFSGFWGKAAVVSAAVQAGAWTATAAALFAGLVNLYVMARLFAHAFWKPAPPRDHRPQRLPAGLVVLPTVVMAGLVVVGGLWAEPLMAFARTAAGHLLDPAAYVAAVLGPAADGGGR